MPAATPRMVVAAWLGLQYRQAWWWWGLWPLFLWQWRRKPARKLAISWLPWPVVYRLPKSLPDESTSYYVALLGNVINNQRVSDVLVNEPLTGCVEALSGCVFRLILAPRVVRAGQSYRLSLWDWSLQPHHLVENRRRIGRMHYARITAWWNHISEQLRQVNQRYSFRGSGSSGPSVGFVGTLLQMHDDPQSAYELLSSDVPLWVVLEKLLTENVVAEYHNRQARVKK